MWNIGCDRCSREYDARIEELEARNEQLCEFIKKLWKNEIDSLKGEFQELIPDKDTA